MPRLSERARQTLGAPLAEAFAHTLAWALALTLLALVPATILVAATRRAERAARAQERLATPV